MGQPRYVLVSKDGAEIAWGKDKSKVQDAINRKGFSVFQLLFGGKPAQKRMRRVHVLRSCDVP